jgi:hypothetical protein
MFQTVPAILLPHEHCSAKTVFMRITFRQDAFLQFSFPTNIAPPKRSSCGSHSGKMPSCNSPSKRKYSAGRRTAFHLEGATKLLHLPTEYPTQHTQGVVELEGELQEAFIGKKLLIKKLSLGENCYLCWQSSHLRRWI